MNPERWKQIDALLSAALQCEEGQRAGFLAQACEGDEELQKQVQQLVSAHEAAASFLKSQSGAGFEPVSAKAAKASARANQAHVAMLSWLRHARGSSTRTLSAADRCRGAAPRLGHRTAAAAWNRARSAEWTRYDGPVEPRVSLAGR